MRFLYNILMIIVWGFLNIIALFNKKLGFFVSGRKQSFDLLKNNLKKGDKTIWFHVASLGEYEQGLPLIEKFKNEYSDHKIIVTFFSPSGYEVRKNNAVADITLYLPWDTKSNVIKFLDLVQPQMAFFVKYEFWINYLSELEDRKIKTYLVSGIFREKQAFFKFYGGFYRKALNAFDYFFVQNESSKLLISNIGFNNVMVSGDTRFDRVYEIFTRDNSLSFVEDFKQDDLLLVAGSTWETDEALLVNFINQSQTSLKVIIAPHNIKSDQIQQLKSKINKSIVLYSEIQGKDISKYEVMIVDTVGLLTKIYSYADLAYVGGGFGNPGVHNVLEPAVFGIPIVIGPNYSHFAEATSLVNLGGITSIENQFQINSVFMQMISDESFRKQKGKIASEFVLQQKGATLKILNYFKTN